MTTTLEARTERRAAPSRRDRLTLALSDLFTTRADLDGISPVADVLTEDLLWSV